MKTGMSKELGRFITVRNALPRETLRLFGRENSEWLPSTSADLVHNEWVALVLQDGPEPKVIGALSWLRDTPEHQCFITGICTDYRYRRMGVARALFLQLLIEHKDKECEIIIDMPSAMTAAGLFFEHYGFAKKRGSFHCPDGYSVEYSYSPHVQNAPRPFNPGGQVHSPKRPS